MEHRGPFLDEYQQAPRKYNWPDWRVQTFFKKSVSPLWQKKLEAQYSYDDDQLKRKFDRIASDIGRGPGMIGLDQMAEICDKFGLHLLMNSEDMSYHFKFVDVIQDTYGKYLDDGNGNIDFAKFKIWWNMDIEQLMAKDEVPPV